MSLIRTLLEKAGLVREENHRDERYAEADAAIADARTVARDSREARLATLSEEDQSYRSAGG